MNYTLFAVYDRVAGAYGAPQIAINEATAIRSFKQQAKNSPFNTDLELYSLGTFNGESGLISATSPVFLARYSEGDEGNA